jgi:surface polysaccharide O-acyltransferase-like enzyme
MGALSPDVAYVNHPEKLRVYHTKRKTFGIISVIGLIGAIFFLSNNLTGNIVGNLNNSTMNVFGIIFAVICICGLFLFAKNKTNVKVKKKYKKISWIIYSITLLIQAIYF